MVCSLFAKAQEQKFHQYTLDDGLPTNYVYGVIEDRDGYIWVYTENGISKFDGYEFENYNIHDGLPGNDIFQLLEGVDERIWMLGVERQPAFIQADSIVSSFKHNEPTFKVDNSLGPIRYLMKSGGLEAQGDSLKAILFDPPNPYSFIKKEHSIFRQVTHLEKENFTIFFPTEGKFFEVIESDTFEYKLSSKSLIDDSLRGALFYLVEGENPFYLGLLDKGMILVDQNTKGEKLFPWTDFFEGEINMSAFQLHRGAIFISTNRGVVKILLNQEIDYSLEFNMLADQYRLNRTFEDSHGNLWIGTWEAGLHFLSNIQKESTHITTQRLRDRVIEDIVVMDDDRLIAISTIGSTYSFENDSLKPISLQTDDFKSSFKINDHQLLLANLVDGIKLIEDGQLKLPSSLNFSAFQGVLKLTEGFSMHVDTMGGFFNVIVQSEDTIYLNHNYGLYQSIGKDGLNPIVKRIHDRVNIMACDSSKSKILVADGSWLYKINKAGEINRLINIPAISKLLFVDENTLLIATESSGLYKYSFADRELIKLSKDQSIKEMILHDNDLLIAFANGVKQLELKDTIAISKRIWGVKDGLLSGEVLDLAILNDQLYVCSNLGVSLFDLNEEVTSSKEFNFDSEINSLKNTQVISGASITYDDNDLRAKFSLLDYESLGKIKYEYRLEPIQADWQTTKSREVLFYDLEPGDYTFSVRAYDFYEAEITMDPISFTIKKPFWKTALFYLIAGILLLILIWFLDYKRRENLQNKFLIEKRQNKALANLKLEALRSQMNPHFVFNALGSIQYYIQLHKIEAADNYLTLFAKLMRKYLHFSSEDLISLRDEISLLKDYLDLEQMRFEDLFKFTLKVDERIAQNEIYLPSMLIQPFVENAINHGLHHRKDKAGCLKIIFDKYQGTKLKISIIDNGIGRDKAKVLKEKVHKSAAMENIAQRIEHLENTEQYSIDIDITNNSDDIIYPGTRIIIYLNPKKNELQSNNY